MVFCNNLLSFLFYRIKKHAPLNRHGVARRHADDEPARTLRYGHPRRGSTCPDRGLPLRLRPRPRAAAPTIAAWLGVARSFPDAEIGRMRLELLLDGLRLRQEKLPPADGRKDDTEAGASFGLIIRRPFGPRHRGNGTIRCVPWQRTAGIGKRLLYRS